MKVRVLTKPMNFNSLFSKFFAKLEDHNYKAIWGDVYRIRFYKKNNYLSHNWERYLSKLRILNSGEILMRNYKERNYLIGNIHTRLSFGFVFLLFSLVMLLIIIRLDFSLLLIPILLILLYGIIHFVYYLKIKYFIKDLIK